MEIRTTLNYIFDYGNKTFKYYNVWENSWPFVVHTHYFKDVINYTLIEESAGASSFLFGKRYNVNVSLDGQVVNTISIKCKNLAMARSIISIFDQKSQKKIETRKNSNLKEKLNEILELKKEGLLTEEEYELKRKEIINNY